jgi:glycosyltransferase involved in cell wall biosynthesis
MADPLLPPDPNAPWSSPLMRAFLSEAQVVWPRITVVTPSFNQGRYIEETLSSVLDQGYPNLEYIVIDGGSTDDTVPILNRYRERLAYWVSEPDKGQSEAINKGFARASGDILGWLNSDDKLAPGALWAVAAAFRDGVDLVAGVVDVARDGERLYSHRTGLATGALSLEKLLDLPSEWLEGRFFFQPEVYISRQALDRVGRQVDASLFYSMDYDLWVRLAEAGSICKPIDWTVAEFRVHAEQKTSTVAAYLPELTAHNDRLRSRLHLTPMSQPADPSTPRRAARIGMVNDFGFSYGAGRAHHRIASVLAASGMEVAVFALSPDPNAPASSLAEAAERMAEFKPDVIIVGNLHGVLPKGADLSALSAIAPLLIVTHDFFWFTGRCPYPKGCIQYLSLCSPECPTRDEYPTIDYDAIPAAHAAKAALWRSPRVFFAANSNYVTRELKRFLSEQAPGAEARLQQIRLGVPEGAYRPRERRTVRARFGLSDADFVVLVSSTSVSERRKRVQHVLTACRASGIARLTILAMGHVEPADRLQDVVYTGYLTTDDDIADCFSAADIFMGASEDETFGQTFVEAAMCGCPSLAYDVGALRETVIDGETGWLVPDGDIEALTAALRRYAANPDSRTRVRASAFLYARSHFGLASMLQSWQEVLRDIIDGPEVRVPTGVQYGGQNARSLSTLNAQRWKAAAGFGLVEGPYPQFGINRRLWWQVATTGILEIRVPAAGVYEITLECETAARDQVVDLKVGAVRFLNIELQPSEWRLTKIIRVRVALVAGWTAIHLSVSRGVELSERTLWLAIFDVAVAPTSRSINTGDLSRRLGSHGESFLLDHEPIKAEQGAGIAAA